MFYEVIPVKAGLREVLTYACNEELLPGQIVEVPLMRSKVAGVISKKVVQPNFRCREIVKTLYSKPLPAHLMQTAKFIAEYYLAPIGSVMAMILPNGILKKRREGAKVSLDLEKELADGVPKKAQNGLTGVGWQKRASFNKIMLNPTQKSALEGLQKAPGATKLLFGVTGSGKTNVYLSEAARALKKGFSVVLLVPEIGLTGQLAEAFREFFEEKVTLIHSGLTEAERHRIFEGLLLETEPRVIIGARSALFAPLDNLGLIIIDEEHETTYFQENTPHYSAIRVASFMAKGLGISCILGSATPAVSDYYLANRLESVVVLDQKAKLSAKKPEISLIDFKNRGEFSKNRYFSNALIMAIRDNLAAGRQTLIFHNRRGSAPLSLCEKCGEELACPNCFLPLTLHADTYELTCHTCGFSEVVPSVCPKCGASGIIHKGFGTKLLENELRKLFPLARIKRFDADNKKGEGLEAVYDAVRDGEVDILIGTQVVAKGLDLPRLATVGVVQADAGLTLPDFMAEERSFQLLTQVIGRVGRGHLDIAEVIIQTFQPEHPVLGFAMEEDYVGFSEYLLKKRRKSGFPPFWFMARLEIAMKTEASVVKKVQVAAKQLSANKKLLVSPPMPAFHERTRQGFTWQIVVRAKSRKALVQAIMNLDPNFKITLDPPSLL